MEIFSKGSPGWCGSVGYALFFRPKGRQFKSQSGHMPGLWVRSLVRVGTEGNQSTFFSHISISLPPFPSLKKIILYNIMNKK